MSNASNKAKYKSLVAPSPTLTNISKALNGALLAKLINMGL